LSSIAGTIEMVSAEMVSAEMVSAEMVSAEMVSAEMVSAEMVSAGRPAPMPGSRERPFGIYVHVPFCRRRCDYCAFATWTDKDHLWERYIAACRAEAATLTMHNLTVHNLTVHNMAGPAGLSGPADARGPATSVFFGGGTPSLLPADYLAGILEALRGSIGIVAGAEVTVECNPETVSAAKLAQYRASGVTRLSFGAQSMVPHVLEALGRQHEPASVRRAAKLAGEAGFAGAYNVDLIFGAAGETMADWRASLDAVVALEPTPAHISAYALTVEPGTPLAAEPARHPSDDDQAEKYLLTEAVLADAGFEWYEISNWARPGARCAHNLLYWSQGEYRGIGCAAHSHLVRPDGSARRWWNVRTPERYCRLVETGSSLEAAGETLGPEQRVWERLVLSLRTSDGVPASAVPGEVYDAGLVELQAAGVRAEGAHGHGADSAEASGARAVLTPKGRLLANEVAIKLVKPVFPQ
jgi:putative oxygen-independent coproporphyrinogen III oxidase